MKKVVGLIIIIAVATLGYYFFYNADVTEELTEMTNEEPVASSEPEPLVPLDQILSGGPPPDGIPPIDDPKYVSIEEASDFVEDATMGILIQAEDDVRFYPYNIMVWHEIVNDKIGDTPVSVTFCPLCGSGIVFERTIDGKVYDFGTSGKLYNSNLVMYDRQTESYWSQALGKAIVGPLTGTELKLYPMALVTFDKVKSENPNAKVLSKETGYNRNYTRNPYQGYEDNESLFFPVSHRDERLHPKQLMYVIAVDDVRKAYHYKNLADKGGLTDEVNGKQVEISLNKEGQFIAENGNGSSYPGYVEMWFSFITNHPDAPVWIE